MFNSPMGFVQIGNDYYNPQAIKKVSIDKSNISKHDEEVTKKTINSANAHYNVLLGKIKEKERHLQKAQNENERIEIEQNLERLYIDLEYYRDIARAANQDLLNSTSTYLYDFNNKIIASIPACDKKPKEILECIQEASLGKNVNLSA